MIGIDQLDDIEKATLNKLAKEYHDKIERELKNATSVVVHIKQHTKGGKRKKSDIRVKVVAPTRIFESQESEWDLAKALHKAFINVIKEIQHTFHTDDQRPGKYV